MCCTTSSCALQAEVGRLKDAQQEASTAAEQMSADLKSQRAEVERLQGHSTSLERTSSQQLQSQKYDMESLHRSEVCEWILTLPAA